MQHEIVTCGVPFDAPNIREILKKIKEDGFTAVQIYMHWNKFEGKARGQFDFSYYDKDVELLKEAGLKFVPFFLMGPRYAAPDWWLNDEKQRGLVCLEHGKESPIDSIWSEDFRNEVDRVMGVFAEHYLPMDILESFQPGICGDYGEAIMPVHGNWPGAYHSHKGMWCAGEDAVESFGKAMKDKYADIDALNKAWRSYYKSFEEISTFLQHMAPSRTAWFDLIEWYRDSMTEYSEFWMKTSRKHFPDIPIYLCTGGIETPEHASLFSDQAKIAAKYGGGIRLTNERNDFFSNFFDCNAYMHNACELYGAYLGLEPVGPMTKEGIGSRILGSAIYGNRQIFFYFSNIYPNNEMDGECSKIFKKYINLIQERRSDNKFAVLWPKYVGIMEGGIPERIRKTAKFIRQRTDYRFVNENMIADGALDDINLLILPCDIYTDNSTLEYLCEWVENGGILFAVGRVTDLELNCNKKFNEMLGITEDTEYCEGISNFEIMQDIPFKSYAALKNTFSEWGYSNISDDAKVIAVSKGRKFTEYDNLETSDVYSAFYRKHGKGMAISYFGPVDFENDPQGIFKTGDFKYLLDDVLSNYAKDLRIEAGEVVRGEIEGQVYALMPDGEIKKVQS